MLTRAKNAVSYLGCSLGPQCWPGPTQLYIFFILKKHIHIYNLYSILKISESMMFYRLDSFTQYLPPFLYQGMGSNYTSCIVFFNILR
jgi:hypothetical protein